MSRLTLRPILATTFAVIVCLAVSPRPGAVGSAILIPERLVADAVNMTAGGPVQAGRIDIVIERWSTEAERENLLRTTIDGGPAKLLAALETVTRRAGFVLSPGLQGLGERSRKRRARNIEFAYEITTPAGRQVVVATDEHLRFGDPALTPRPTEHELTLIDIRFGPDGVGVGRLASESKVTYNRERKTIELENFDTLPERLSAVRSEPWHYDPERVAFRGLLKP